MFPATTPPQATHENAFKTLKTLLEEKPSLEGCRVLVRVDFNVPLRAQSVEIRDPTRIMEALETLNALIKAKARILVLSHRSTPDTLTPVVPFLEAQLKKKISFIRDRKSPHNLRAIQNLKPGDIALLENTRLDARDVQNDATLADELAALGDLCVFEAFSVAHRAHASTSGIIERLPSYGGIGFMKEWEALNQALNLPQRPLFGLIGGSKLSTKLLLIKSLLEKVDALFIGGAMAHTFLLAQGISIGASLSEDEWVSEAQKLLNNPAYSSKIILPQDGVILTPQGVITAQLTRDAQPLGERDKIMDIGPLTVEALEPILHKTRTVLWNGPFGVFEDKRFAQGTQGVASLIAEHTKRGECFSLVGGGDTCAALRGSGGDNLTFSHVSTSGGALLALMKDQSLPALNALRVASLSDFQTQTLQMRG